MSLNPSAKEQLPNLYALLFLTPLESNRAKIEDALAQLATLLESQRLQDPKAIKNAKRILALGRQHLLSDELKQIYDQRWRQTFGAAMVHTDLGPTQQTSGWDMRELDQLLPTEDPNRPFDLTEFLQSPTSRRPQDVEADFAKILSLLSAASETAHSASSTASTTAEPPESQAVGQNQQGSSKAENSKHIHTPPVAVATKFPLGNSTTSAATLLQKRKQRERSLLWMVVGALFCVGSVLAILFWRQIGAMKSGSSSIASGELINSTGTVQVQPNTEPRRSGLPQVQGLDASAQSQLDRMGEMTPALPDESPFPVVEPLTAEMPEGPQPALTNDIPMPANSPDTSTQLGPPLNQPTNSNPPPTTLTDTEKQDWLTTLARIKTTIGTQDYAAAEKEITDARANAKTSEQSTQILQLSTIRQLAQELSEAMRQAAAGMGAGEVFTIGTSTPVSLVEVTDDRLIVRIRGQNLSFSFSEVPIGLAFGLADLKMEVNSPTSKARKAAFTLAHPGAAKNDLAQQRARSMMAEAIAAGVVPEDLMQAFED